jgi:hypothetical protein
MTDPKEEVAPIMEKEAEKAEDEKKSETEEKEKLEEKVEQEEDKMETDDKEKGDDAKKDAEEPKEEDVVAKAATTTKKRKKEEPTKAAAPDEGDDKDKEESETAADGRPKREKRVRKTADVFEPDNFLGKDKSQQVVVGRGTKLADIAAVKASIDKLTMNSSELMLAHRLLYTRQGKPPKKEIKKNLFDFCGFLPLAEEGQDKKELEALDEEAEVRMSMAG